MDNFFEIKTKDDKSQARLGLLHTAHGNITTPAFLPIGSQGGVKSVLASELGFWGAEIILANTYHLWMRPGDTLIKKHGGLHKFISWDGPILTDSGGFQVFSLGEKRSGSRQERPDREHGRVLKIANKGVVFRSDVDGQQHELTPETSIQIQSNLGSDIALALDYFPGYPFQDDRVARSVKLTLDWAKRSQRHFEKIRDAGTNPGQVLFGIVQGGDSENYRAECVEGLKALDFPGYGIGGVAVGEPSELMYKTVKMTVPLLEEEKPRHLLGIGLPEQLIGAVALGCDMFDCVLPTRNARHGLLYINLKPGEEKTDGYRTLRISNQQYKDDLDPVDNTCGCYLCTTYSRSYLRHLFWTGDPLALRLATMHNLRFYLDLMKRIQTAVQSGSFSQMVENYQQY